MNKKNNFLFSIDTNAIKDDGEGRISFSKPLVITDNSVQRNGTQYDIKSMDLSEYSGILTADHGWNIGKVIGKTFGLAKRSNDTKVTIDGIQFAVKENPLALYAYNMLKAGYVTDFSIETYGPWPNDDGIYENAKLVGLSVVVTGNNKSASINEIAQVAYNSAKEARESGLDASFLEKQILGIDKEINRTDNEDTMKFVIIKNNRKFAVKVSYKNSADEETEVTVAPGSTVEVPEGEKDKVEGQIGSAEEPKTDAPAVPEVPSTDVPADQKFDEIIKNAVAPLLTQIKDLETKVFDNSAKEPEFRASDTRTVPNGKASELGYKERHGLQINAAWELLKNKNSLAGRKLEEINKFNLEQLQKENIVPNSITIADMGNFVISPELLRDIEGVRSDFQPLLSRLNFRETLSLQMAWLVRNGDVNMQEVEMCDDGADGNLKPISEYDATIKQSNLHELAAVTPVCNAATRFLAVDLLQDVAAGYRTDYDRKRAQLFIVRLQQAVNESGNTTVLNTQTGVLNPLNSIIDGAAGVAETVESGVWIFNTSTYYQLLKYRMAAGANQDGGFDLFTTGENPSFLGRPYIVVPNELMPTLNTAQTKSFTVEGTAVTINQGMFYVDLNTFSGRTSGGLMYDLSTEAAYEVGGETRSAFQRNELVLRGSFFRGGAVRDIEKVAGVGAPGVS